MKLSYKPFPKAFVQIEKQTTLFRIWTRVNNSISYDESRYTKIASTKNMFYGPIKNWPCRGAG